MVIFHCRVIVDQRVPSKIGRLWLVSKGNVLWKNSTNEVFVDVEHILFKYQHIPTLLYYMLLCELYAAIWENI